MNLRIARAFWFYHATRTWPFILFGLSLGIIVALTYYIVFHDEYANPRDFLIGMLVFAIPIQLLGMLYNASVADSFTCRLPESTLLLPTTSFAIAFHRFAFNLAVVAATFLFFYGLNSLMFGAQSQQWWHWLLLIAGLAAFLQAAALATAPTGDWTIGFLIGAVWIYFSAESWIRDEFAQSVPVLFYVGTIGLSFVAMWTNVYLIRRGIESPSIPALRLSPQTKTRHTYSAKPFKSAWHALLWLETLRYWRPVSRTFIVLAAGYVVLLAVRAGTDSNIGPFRVDMQSAQVHFSLFGYFAFTASVIGGIVVSLQNRRIQTGPMAAFLYIRPVSTPQLATVRIIAALRIWAIIAAVAVVWTITARVVFEGAGTYGATAEIIAIALPLAAALWAGLWTWNLIALIPIYIVALCIALPFAMNNPLQNDEYIAYGFTFLVVLSIGVVFVLAWRKRLSQPSLFWSFTPAVLASFLVWFFAVTSETGNPNLYAQSHAGNYLLLIAVLAYIIAPLATVPLAHHWSRHR